MSNQLRYLLHGNKEKYEDTITPLYKTSQESTVWQKLGKKVLQIKGEDWRLIDSLLIEYIPSAKSEILGIKLLQSEEVVDLIRELGVDCVDGNFLKPSERYELLRYISQRPSNQELWKSLPLHETVDGELVNIEAEGIYLENPDFPLDERLQEHIVLIRQNREELNQDWIPLWTPEQAISTILNLPNPSTYCILILNALQQLSTSEKDKWETQLKNNSWLVDVEDRAIPPRDIIRFPIKFLPYQQKLQTLDSTKYTELCLPNWVKNHQAYSWVKRIFTFWNEQTILEKVFHYPQRTVNHWRSFCLVILDTLPDIDISNNQTIKTLLRTETWLVVQNQLIAPHQIIEIIPIKIREHLSRLVELSHGEYAELSLLDDDIQNHDSLKIVKKLFSSWYENDVIDFIIHHRQPHLYFDIILDALSSLFSNKNAELNANNHQSLKTQSWLVDIQGNAIYPPNVIHYPSLENEIEELLILTSSSNIVSSQLIPEIRNYESCWKWLIQELFLTEDQVISQVGLLLKEADNYQLGEFEIDEFPLNEVWKIFNNVDVSFLPVWNFAQQINPTKFKKYLLPNLLGKLNQDYLIKILKNIVSLNDEPDEITIKVFNSYLKLAVNHYHTFPEILSKINLLNRRKHWQTPYKLTWGNRENIDSNFLLDQEQSIILKIYLMDLQQTNLLADSKTSSIVVNKSNFDVLQNYFRAWENYCPTEPIGAFLALLYGAEKSVQNLANLYLGKRDLGILRQGLFEEQPITNRFFRIHVGQASDTTREVPSIMGFNFQASLVNTKNPPHLFVSRLAPDVTELELLPIELQQFNSSELVNLLKKSTKILLEQVYELTSSSLEQIWEGLLNSDQLDIQVAKEYLIEDASSVMRTLGADKRIPAIKTILTRWDDLRHQRAELNQQSKPIEPINRKIKTLISELSNLLENESSESQEIREGLWESVRDKIHLYGYQNTSIPFELFQNADDAVVEWMGMSSPKKLEDTRKQFIIVLDDNKLQFIHGGRPISCFQHPEHPGKQYREQGFHRDLEKMLSFNISDKGDGVTGKFGLGFKSIYLVSKQPYILSKNLGFTVEGGLMPARINAEKTSELRSILKRYINLADATIIELALEENISWQNLLQHFLSVTNILLIFSKGIKTCKFIDQHHQETTLYWNPSTFLGISGVEIGTYNDDNAQNSVFLCLKTGTETNATLVLGLVERNGIIQNALPKYTPTFWVTAPTKEQLFLNFVLNADFEITTGRESLVKSSIRNRDLALQIGASLGEVLYNFFCASQDNWEALSDAFDFIIVDEYDFWNYLWEELAVRWQKNNPDEGIDIIRQMLTGDRAMGYLIIRCQSLPSGLCGRYRQLILLDDVKHEVTGKLSDSTTFLEVADWPGFQNQYDNNLIASGKWEEVRNLLGSQLVQRYTIKELWLLDVLKNEIGNSQPQIKPLQARYLGNLLTKDFFYNLNPDSELIEVQSFLETAYFMSKADSYLPCQQLLTISSSVIEEKLLADFAPTHRILNPDYQDSALNFFYACRSRRENIDREEIIKWVLQAVTEAQRQAVYVYLLNGVQREEIAPVLYSSREHSWFANDKQIIDILEYMVLIVTERAELAGEPDPLEIAKSLELETIYEEDVESHNPFFEIYTSCTSDDFSLERSSQELEEFASQLQIGLNRQNSIWQGYTYHFTHIENAVSILKTEKILARNLCQNFKDSAGANIIARTSENVKDFARFYFRPQTPTQWHNEGLGKRRGKIYALCPVPIFFCFNLKRVLETHGSKCGISSGNLAALGSHYGNSTTFLEECFDFDYVYSSLQKVGKETFLRASQQEFIIYNHLDFTQLNLEDITIICRTNQDKETLLNLLGKDSKYISRIFKEREIVNEGTLFYNHNPYVTIKEQGEFIDVQIDNYHRYGDIDGELILSFPEQPPFNRKIVSPFNDISRILLDDIITVSSSRGLQLQYKSNTRMSVHFQEKGHEWLIYTNESKDNQG